MKDAAEKLETTVFKSFEEKVPGVLAEIEGYEEKLRELYLDLLRSHRRKAGYLRLIKEGHKTNFRKILESASTLRKKVRSEIKSGY